MNAEFKAFRLERLHERLSNANKRLNYFNGLIDDVHDLVEEFKSTTNIISELTESIIKTNELYQNETDKLKSETLWNELSDMNEQYQIHNETLVGIKVEIYNIMINLLYNPVKEEPEDYEIDEISNECISLLTTKIERIEREINEIKDHIERVTNVENKSIDEQFPKLPETNLDSSTNEQQHTEIDKCNEEESKSLKIEQFPELK